MKKGQLHKMKLALLILVAGAGFEPTSSPYEDDKAPLLYPALFHSFLPYRPPEC